MVEDIKDTSFKEWHMEEVYSISLMEQLRKETIITEIEFKHLILS